MLRAICVATASAVCATAVLAQTPAQQSTKQRTQIMASFGEILSKNIGPMQNGTEPFDLVKAQAAFRSIAAEAPKLEALFADGSSNDAASRAAPAIWTSKQAFLSNLGRLIEVASAAAEASKDAATLKSEFGKVNAVCAGCHKDYRLPPRAK
jgi:cytochrome c556